MNEEKVNMKMAMLCISAVVILMFLGLLVVDVYLATQVPSGAAFFVAYIAILITISAFAIFFTWMWRRQMLRNRELADELTKMRENPATLWNVFSDFLRGLVSANPELISRMDLPGMFWGAIKEAVARNNVVVFEQLLPLVQEGVDRVILWLTAAEHCSLDVAVYMLRSGIVTDVNVHGNYGNTALHVVGTEGSNYNIRKFVRWLLMNGADINAVNTEGNRPCDMFAASAEGGFYPMLTGKEQVPAFRGDAAVNYLRPFTGGQVVMFYDDEKTVCDLGESGEFAINGSSVVVPITRAVRIVKVGGEVSVTGVNPKLYDLPLECVVVAMQDDMLEVWVAGTRHLFLMPGSDEIMKLEGLIAQIKDDGTEEEIVVEVHPEGGPEAAAGANQADAAESPVAAEEGHNAEQADAGDDGTATHSEQSDGTKPSEQPQQKQQP